jgi:hypothetical protein
MNQAEKNLIRNIAKRVRRRAERYADQKGFTDDLAGLCAHASTVLRDELKKVGIRARLAGNMYHAFLTYKGYVIDVTATQFDSYLKDIKGYGYTWTPYPPVMIRPISSFKSMDHTEDNYWKINRGERWFYGLKPKF